MAIARGVDGRMPMGFAHMRIAHPLGQVRAALGVGCPKLRRADQVGDGLGVAARCAVNRADALRGFEMAIRAFDYRVQGADEVIEKASEHLMKVQRAALGVCQVGRYLCVIGQRVKEFPADALEIVAHDVIIGFVVQARGSHFEFGIEDVRIACADAKSDVPRMIPGCKPPPKRVPVAEKAHRFGGAIIDKDREGFRIARPDEAVAFGGFREVVAIKALHGREQNAGAIVLRDQALGCLQKNRADVLTCVHRSRRF